MPQTRVDRGALGSGWSATDHSRILSGEHGYYDRNTYRPIEPSKVLQEDTNKVLICVEVKARWIQGAAVLEKQSVLASNKL